MLLLKKENLNLKETKKISDTSIASFKIVFVADWFNVERPLIAAMKIKGAKYNGYWAPIV